MEFVTEAVGNISLGKPTEDVDDDDESDDENVTNTNAESTGKKKKKKKKKSKAKKAESVVITPPISRLLGGSTDYFTKYGQTNPPTIPVR